MPRALGLPAVAGEMNEMHAMMAGPVDAAAMLATLQKQLAAMSQQMAEMTQQRNSKDADHKIEEYLKALVASQV